MKIAIISPGTHTIPVVLGTSVEHDIQMIAEQMANNEHQVYVYTRKCPEYPKSAKEGNLHYKRFSFSCYKKYIAKVIRHMRRLKPDVILVENRPSYAGTIKEKFNETPVVLNMHSTVFASPPEIMPPEMNRVALQIDALFTNSSYLQNYFEDHYPTLQGKTHAIHLGIDPTPFHKAQRKKEKISRFKRKFNIRKQDQTILFVGRLLEQKGVHLVMDVLPKLVKEHPHLKLIITGSPLYGRNVHTPYVRLLRRRAMKLKGHIVFTKFIPPKKIPYIYQLADVVVIPSLWNEPFGRVNLEAMASTKAVVATDRGGIPELIKHNENGFIVSVDNHQKELYDSISALLMSPELREEFGQKGQEMVKHFTWNKTASKYIEVFEALLEKTHKVE